jgi:hypothetical protein
VIKRREKEPDGDGLPPGHARIASPYDLDARWGVKRDIFWLGYKLHVTETCDDEPRCGCPAAGDGGTGRRGHDRDCAAPAFPNLITHVATADATAPDSQMTSVICGDLAAKNLAPGRSYLDSGYLSAALVVTALATWGIALIGPLLADTSAQARVGNGYARADFAIDYDSETVTCPQGKTSASWTPCTQRGKDAIGVAQTARRLEPLRTALLRSVIPEERSGVGRRLRHRGSPVLLARCHISSIGLASVSRQVCGRHSLTPSGLPARAGGPGRRGCHIRSRPSAATRLARRRGTAGRADAVGAVSPRGHGRFRTGAGERGMTCRFAGNTKPTQLRAPGKINTGITRTKRYCPAPDGTPAKMTVLAHESPHAGQMG